jgi:dCMP deaminase
MIRPDKDEYYLNIAKEVASRTTCLCAKIGALIIKDDQIIATGYVGAPRKTKSCHERGNCLRRQLGIPSGQRYELCRSVHAEQNAIINAARSGVNILGGTMYLYGEKIFEGKSKLINVVPCFICKKMILNSGLKELICNREDGSIKKFDLEKWSNEWKEKDMTEDMEIYNVKYDSK